MSDASKKWVPALGLWRSVSFYVRVVRWFSLNDLPHVIARDLELQPGMRALDLGCGPGTLAQAALALEPRAKLVGLDPDLSMLRHANAQSAGKASWASGFVQALPFPDATFDRVTMTLMLHHLERDQKKAGLLEALRVLRPGGHLFVTDWTEPKGAARLAFVIVRLVDGFAETVDHTNGGFEELLTEIGAEQLEALRTRELAIGTITHFRMRAPQPR
ncbi:MAG: methyltransferase domain-containing protein [Bryobacterales bacterium]|nr:methyltransferase domain-containing protein [Bryobacterales bacterium]